MTITIDEAAVADLWQRLGPALGGGPTPIPFFFGDSPRMADELADLVRVGPKRATAGLVSEFADEGESIPVPGQLSIVVDGSGAPVAIIRTTETRIGPLSSVTDQFAWDEGEGDRTRDWWLDAHRAFFRRQDEHEGRPHDPDPEVVFERFALVWPTVDVEAPRKVTEES